VNIKSEKTKIQSIILIANAHCISPKIKMTSHFEELNLNRKITFVAQRHKSDFIISNIHFEILSSIAILYFSVALQSLPAIQ